MGQMVHDLLDFTRTRLGARLPISAERCDLRTICNRIAEEMRTAHPDRPISVECNGDCAGQWDASRIEQLVSNLIGNAVQHGYAAPPSTSLSTATRRTPSPLASLIAGRPFLSGNDAPYLIRWLVESIPRPKQMRTSVQVSDWDSTSPTRSPARTVERSTWFRV